MANVPVQENQKQVPCEKNGKPKTKMKNYWTASDNTEQSQQCILPTAIPLLPTVLLTAQYLACQCSV
jgi:hypothetical protein